MSDKEKDQLAAVFIIQKQYLKPDETWSDWVDAFTFGDDIIATNDFFDVVQSCYMKAYSPEELTIVPHRWRIFDFVTQEVIECSEDINFIQLSEFGSYDTGGVGAVPYWIEGSSRNIQENIKRAREIFKQKGLLIEDDEDEEEDN